MSRKKMKWAAVGDMFGNDVHLELSENERFMVGHQLAHDPIKRLDKKLKDGYLFRNPNADPVELSTIWKTLEHFTSPYNVWVEHEKKDDDRVELTAFALISDKAEATMFAFAHSHFQKWSAEQEKADRKERSKKPTKVRVTKDGRITARVTVETLGD